MHTAFGRKLPLAQQLDVALKENEQIDLDQAVQNLGSAQLFLSSRVRTPHRATAMKRPIKPTTTIVRTPAGPSVLVKRSGVTSHNPMEMTAQSTKVPLVSSLDFSCSIASASISAADCLQHFSGRATRNLARVHNLRWSEWLVLADCDNLSQ